MLKNSFEVLRSVLIFPQRTPTALILSSFSAVEYSQFIFLCIWDGLKAALAELRIKKITAHGRKEGGREGGREICVSVPICYNSFITLRVFTSTK